MQDIPPQCKNRNCVRYRVAKCLKICCFSFVIVSGKALLGAANITNPNGIIASLNSFWWLKHEDGNNPEIALFRLESYVQISPSVQTIRLPSLPQEFESFEEWSVVVQGYGGGRNVMHFGNFTVMSNDQCGSGEIVVCGVGATKESGDYGKTRKTATG